MRHSAKVKEASKRALSRLFKMEKEELSQRLSEREIGPLGQLLLATKVFDTLLHKGEYQWARVEIHSEIDNCRAADNDVNYALEVSSSFSWATIASSRGVASVFESEGYQWAKAA